MELSLFLPPELPPSSSSFSKKGKEERGTFCSKFRTAAEREWVFEHGQPTYSPDKAQF